MRILIGFAVTLLALVGLAGSSRLSGPVIWRLNESHGLHLDDLGVASDRLRELDARRGEIGEGAAARFEAHRADAAGWWDTVAESLR